MYTEAMEAESLNVWRRHSVQQYQKDNVVYGETSFQKQVLFWTSNVHSSSVLPSESTTEIGPCHHPRVHIWTSSSSAHPTAGADVSGQRERSRLENKHKTKGKKHLVRTHASSLTLLYSCTYTGESKKTKWKPQTKTLLDVCHQKQIKKHWSAGRLIWRSDRVSPKNRAVNVIPLSDFRMKWRVK